MMDAPWLRAAKRLPVGGVERFRCCGSTKAAVIFNKPDAWEMYCHRCKSSPKERKQFVQMQRVQQEARVQPAPADVINIADARQSVQQNVYSFLATKGIMPDMVEDLQWSDTAQRLVFPVSSGLSLGRATTTWQNPKWIQYSGKSSFVACSPSHTVTGIILTEDLLSAKKVQYAVNRFGTGDMAAVALLGTRLDKRLKLWIAQNNFPTLMMLDGDEAGHAGVARIKRELRPYVKTGIFYVGGKDPKDLTIKEILDGIELHRPRL